MMDEVDRQLSDCYEHRDMMVRFIAYYEAGGVIRPLGEDSSEATAQHLERLRAEKAYLDDLIPKLEAMKGGVTDRHADADPEEGVMVTGVGPMTLRRAVRKRTDWREHHGLSLVSVFRGADKEPSAFDLTDLDRLAEMERFR